MKKQIQEKGEQKGKQIGIQEGEEKGIKKRNQEIAKHMLIKGMDMKIIEEVTGLSRQWIGRLRNEINQEK